MGLWTGWRVSGSRRVVGGSYSQRGHGWLGLAKRSWVTGKRFGSGLVVFLVLDVGSLVGMGIGQTVGARGSVIGKARKQQELEGLGKTAQTTGLGSWVARSHGGGGWLGLAEGSWVAVSLYVNGEDEERRTSGPKDQQKENGQVKSVV
ncbi:uncharacterized protein LOC133801771 [Humulus lupulus]|uniref:uncharacterized protein LOC133801771 n=1 Tax=Humulus lupulus TaxID=3486 RepID=UPI002B403155|nr:uncharacterized protein LOC133801771 [Humulus lupulus]